MNIAVLAWGSLIWCPGNLRITTRWRLNGPKLPIEFTRISEDGRLTLVIHEGVEDQQTYWAISELTTLDAARRNLHERENAKLADIHYLVRNGPAEIAAPGPIIERVCKWLAMHEDLQAVIWTGLRTNWREKREHDFAAEDAVSYLQGLEATTDRAKAIYDRAREYVRNTPPQIQTAVRNAMRARGWEDAQLSRVLFEA
jgi:hypothetical protein